jgi:proteasome-associated ATPase
MTTPDPRQWGSSPFSTGLTEAQYNAEIMAKNLQLEKAKAALTGARAVIAEMQDELDRLSSPPMVYGVFEKDRGDGTASVLLRGDSHVVTYDEVLELVPGDNVLVNESLAIVEVDRERTLLGQAVTVLARLDEERLLVEDDMETRVVLLSTALRDETVRPGDKVLLVNGMPIACELVPDEGVEDLLLEKVPDISYADIGGLSKQVEEIRDAIELPYLHADLYAAYALAGPKGVLLYGAPGCGKTLIAKAVASSLAKQSGAESAYFLNIKGPELLTKWVGETEARIRDVFTTARDKADEGSPVVIFFDEIESMFRTRGSGISSDVESTIVPSLLAELDGVESLGNVIVIGATNRPDLIDPAVLRPGRLDIKIKVERPDRDGATEIFGIYLNDAVPLRDESAPKKLIDAGVAALFAESDEHKFLEVTYARGDTEILYFKDFISGAVIENIVARAKKLAIKDELNGERRGLTEQHVLHAVRKEFAETEDLPNTTSPEDWSKIVGKKGEKIINVRNLTHSKDTSTETVTSTGVYL